MGSRVVAPGFDQRRRIASWWWLRPQGSLTIALPLMVLLATAPAGGQDGPDVGELVALQVRHRRVMGTQCSMTAVVPADRRGVAETALARARDVIEQLEAEVSSYRPDSQISQLNLAPAGQAVTLPRWSSQLVGRSRRYARQTDGAFDVTCRPILQLWRQAARDQRLPTPEALEHVRQTCGWDLLEMHLHADGTVAITKRADQVSVDLGGVAKGFGIDLAVEQLEQAGCVGGLVDIGGDVRCFGRKAGGGPWRVLIRDPFRPQAEEGFCVVQLEAGAVCTSGDYFRYVEIEGRRFSHIVDPRTAQPVDFAPSVTVIADTATTADAWATALSVLGHAGLERLPREHGLEAMVVTGGPFDYQLHMTQGFADALARRPALSTATRPAVTISDHRRPVTSQPASQPSDPTDRP